MRLSVAPLAFLAAAVTAACASRSAGMRDCSGDVLATVRNQWVQPVDVYVEMDRGSGMIIGEVAPGERREFLLPDGATGLFYRWRSGYVGPRPTGSDIRTTYMCR